MITDKNGCSTTIAGQEQYEKFTVGFGRRKRTAFQYDFRNESGELFSCVASSVEACRAKRDNHFNQ